MTVTCRNVNLPISRYSAPIIHGKCSDALPAGFDIHISEILRSSVDIQNHCARAVHITNLNG